MEGGAGDVVVAPFDHQDVVASLLQQVGHSVLQVAQVFDLQLLTGDLGAADTHHEHVLPWGTGGGQSIVRLNIPKINVNRLGLHM